MNLRFNFIRESLASFPDIGARFLPSFVQEDFSRWLFVQRRSADRYKSPSRRSRTHNLHAARYNRTRSSGYATGCAYARLHCRRSHLHAEDAPTRFQPHSPGRRRCIQGLYCLLICSPFRLASVSMGIVVPFGTKCRSESLRTERALNEKLCLSSKNISPEIVCKKRQRDSSSSNRKRRLKLIM